MPLLFFGIRHAGFVSFNLDRLLAAHRHQSGPHTAARQYNGLEEIPCNDDSDNQKNSFHQLRSCSHKRLMTLYYYSAEYTKKQMRPW